MRWGRLFEYAARDGSQQALVSIIINGPEMGKNMAQAYGKVLRGEWLFAPQSRGLRIDGCEAFYIHAVADSRRPYRLILTLMHDYTVVLTVSDTPVKGNALDGHPPSTVASNSQALLESLRLRKDYRIYSWLFRTDGQRLRSEKDGRFHLGYGYSVGLLSGLDDR